MAIICFFALTAALGAPAAAQTPFGAPPAPQQEHAGPSAPSASSPLVRFRIWVQTTQRDLYRRLAGAVKRVKEEGEGLSAAWLLAGLSFFYGVVHAAGPGHGKAVISSYVVASERTVRRGIALSFLASLMQALTAVVVVTVLTMLLNAAGLRIKDAARSLEIASHALVAAVGAWLVWCALVRIRNRRAAAAHATLHHAVHDHAHGPNCGHGDAHDHHGHEPGHDGCCGHAHLPDANRVASITDWKSAAAIVLAVGLRPCTGALLVLVFAFANGLFLAGVGATFAMSLGTAITVSVLAVLAVTSRELAMRLAGAGSRGAERVLDFAVLGGGLLVLALGLILLGGAMEPARPF